MPTLTLRVFVSSPGDVKQERNLTEEVLTRLQKKFQHVCRIVPYFWEYEPLTADRSFQAGITSTRLTDIVVCILWSRLGQRLLRGATASRDMTGTEYEFEEAVAGKRESGRPDLLVYRKEADKLVAVNTPAAAEAFAQSQALAAFFERFFKDETGALVAAFHPFKEAADFQKHLGLHLDKLIRQRLTEAEVLLDDDGPADATWTEGSPFRELAHFAFEHADVFCGRATAVGEAIDKLKRQAAADRREGDRAGHPESRSHPPADR